MTKISLLPPWPNAKALRRDGEYVLFRLAADRDMDNRLVVATTAEQPAPRSVERLKHEYVLRDSLHPDWAAKPLTLTHEHGRSVLVLSDPGGELLSRFLDRHWETGTFLRIAIGMSVALGCVHAQGLIHKDIKPDHVLVDPDTGTAWLTGFGIASRLARERQAPDLPETIAGTLAYMAPEQTGRMNRSVDARSDLYALGVTFYQMLTGELPFTATDPMELVHYHIARQPVPPIKRVLEVPGTLSAIVVKLLAKTAEERYQTAAGVASDLKRCLAQWEATGNVEDFALGEHDRPDRLLIPEKLYGREGEVDILLSSFDRMVKSGKPELVLVSGYSGIGKSAVVNELHKPLVPPRGLFASGKFDQYKRDIPYATLAQAFQSLVRPLLSKSEEELSKWRDALHAALDPNGQLMVGLVPELKTIIGEQPPVPELPPQEEQRRFHLVFRRFIGVFARPEHPLALFLDDLQWLDAATLDLMEDLLTQPDVKHLMLIGAYRDNEVDATHPLMRKLQAMRQAGASLQDIVLAPLTRENLAQLIADSLRCEPGDASPLAELVHDKTTGNPFFAIQFLSALFEEGLLDFDHIWGRWSWDLNRIHAKGYTDNVVDLMVRKLARLVPETQNALKELACLGNSAEFAMLRVVYQDSIEQMHAELAEAVGSGFILRSKDSYRFLHDRVQEAAYSLIPEEGRAQAHLRIGRLLAAHTSPNEREERIFEIVNQLNRGAALIDSGDERERLAELNLIASKRAKASTAYVSALHYLVAGTTLLADGGWDYRPDLMFALEFHRAECEFLTGELAAAEARLVMLASRAAGPVDQAAVACLRIDLYTTLMRSDFAVDVALGYLRNLGGEWEPHPTEEAVRREYERTRSLLGDREIDELIALPLMSKPESAAAVEVMDKAIPPATFTDRNLFVLLLWRIVNFSLEHGNTDASCYAYVHGGVLAGVRFGNYKFGFRLGQLGYDLVERRGLRRFKARTHIGFGVYTVSWTRHWRMARELIRQGFDSANTIGDVTWAAYSWHNLIGNFLAAGDALAEAQGEAERGLAFALKIRFGLVVDNIATQLALIRTLRGSTATFGCFNGAEFDEAQMERRFSSDPGLAFTACWYWIRKLQARFFAGDYLAAIDASLNAQPLLWASEGFVESAEACFYSALSHAASCDAALPGQYRQHVEPLTAYHKQLAEWAENCPENFENRAALVGAEIARIEGRHLDAGRLYERAIKSARDNGFVHNEGLAYELAARFYLGRSFDDIGTLYLRKARHCYLRWGADGKVRQLDETYPGIREEERSIPSTSTITTSVEGLDLATVIKVSQAVSGEIVLEKMLDVLMRIAITHAGAGRGLLILARPGEHWIVAEVTVDGGTVAVQMSNQSVGAEDLPQSVYHYVLRTHENVILDDAGVQGPFTSDPYIRQQRARSILCLPLLKQATLIGVLYLENPLAARAFTPARIAVLDLLASQAAIAIENARLYADLQKAHRLEAMGTLAGGIAHDFNNILSAILGYGEMALRDAPNRSRLARDLRKIMVAGERGRALVDRVLAFSRSSVAERVVVHVEGVIREALDLLGPKIPQGVLMEARLDAGPAAILGDPTQVHQVLMNLATNAIQAMPAGGTLTVSLEVFQSESARPATVGNLSVAEYIRLTVADSGGGISQEIIDKIFDPFFSTKKAGSGTGLGLSLVHGIVMDLGGAMDVRSRPGAGSTFTVFLPRSGSIPETVERRVSTLPVGNGEHVLVVDDEEPLVTLAARTLKKLGYVPVSFTSGIAALAAFRDDPSRFDAMITDERMPDISGCALVREARALRPRIPTLLISGYVGGGLMERAREAGVDDVLKKPLSAHDLATGLARVLQK